MQKKLIILIFTTLFGICNPQMGTSQWVRTSCPANTQVLSLAIDGAYIFAGTSGNGIFRSSDNGNTWDSVNNGLPGTDVICMSTIGEIMIAGTSDSGIFRSTDFGNSWTESNDGVVGGINGLPNLTVFSLASESAGIFAGTGGNALLSTDSGKTWEKINSGLIASTPSCFTNLFDTLFAGTQDEGIFYSTNDGQSWAQADAGLNSDGHSVSAITTSGSNLIAGTNGGNFLSTDGGSAWYLKNPSGGQFGSISDVISKGSYVFGSTQYFFLESNDTGRTWTFSQIGVDEILSIAINDSFIFIGTYGFGVWRSSISNFVSNVSENSNTEISPFEVYPNPFIGTTSIQLYSEVRETATIAIVNSVGEYISTLYNGELDPGDHSFLWNSQNAPNGIYFAIVRLGGKVQQMALSLER